MPILHAHYHFGLVALSLVVAVAASFVAFDLTASLARATGVLRRAWLTCGALAMGFGIWSMHFIGMLAFEMHDMTMAYDAPLMTLSIAVAVFASGCALVTMSRPTAGPRTNLVSAAAMASGIAGMHYLGMYSMRMAAEVEWNYVLVTLSLVIALTASLAAIVIARRLPHAERPRRLQGYASVLMGLAIAGMHYTGMEAATFRHSAAAIRQDAMVVASSRLTMIVALATMLILAIALLASMVDRALTRRTARESDQAKKARDAETASVLKTRFLANMSHEIRTPLGAILGFAEVLLEEDLPAPTRAAHVRTILRSARALSELLDDILDLSKIEMDRLELERRAFELRPFVREVLALLKIKSDEKGLELRFVDDPGVPEFIVTDSLRLRQVLMNIVGNAIKFTAHGSVTLTLGRVDDRGDAPITFVVRDTGIGIGAAQRVNLFQPFSQADSSMTRRFGGTGLGLDISRRLARALGGNVDLLEASAEGEVGCAFVISIACEVAPVGVAEPARREPPAGDDAGLTGVRILLVEDNPDNQTLITYVLERQGAGVVVAENGREGVDAAATGCFDVILMDIQMPIMNGHEAMRAIRASGSRVPIIALTAHAMREERDACLASGCSAYLKKPIHFPDLVATIRDLRPCPPAG